MHSYHDVNTIRVELTAYRKGSLWVKIDMIKRLVQWNDSIQWSNNFMRSLSPSCMSLLEEKLPETLFLQWDEINPDESSVVPMQKELIWEVDVSFSDGEMKRMGGNQFYPQNWNEFKSIIENISRTPFRLK